MVGIMKRILLLAALLLVAIPTASAAVTVAAEDGDLELMAGQSATIPVTVTVTCDEFVLAGAQSITYAIQSTARADLNPTYTAITVAAGASCVPGNTVSGTGDITLSPGTDAVALMPQTLKVYAVQGSTNVSDDRAGNVWVAYNPGHQLTTDIAFPYTWTGGEMLAFNLTIDVTANDDTMIMFFPVSSPANGTVNGIGGNPKFFLRQGDDATQVKPVTWTPPAGAWDNATISFRHYSHCLNGGDLDACEAQFEETVVWTIQNGAPPTPAAEKDSPGVGAGLIIGLLAVAIVVLRRR